MPEKVIFCFGAVCEKEIFCACLSERIFVVFLSPKKHLQACDGDEEKKLLCNRLSSTIMYLFIKPSSHFHIQKIANIDTVARAILLLVFISIN
jgi:hypothetical protein